jgi:RHS repeat-associated protein
MDNTLIDNLSYSYYSNGNRLKSVNDASGNTAGYAPNSGQYLYDANANMTYDPSKKITISYNPLNLPSLVEFDNNDFIEYTYSATGTKLRKAVTSWKTTAGGTTDYSGQFLYQDNELSCIFTPVGRIVPMQYNNETFWKHEYNLKDHLGNTRIVFAGHPHGQPEVMQQTSYYPFGMTLQQQNFGGALNQPNKLLYNGKELQDDELAGVSLDWYDYGARFYDAVLGRWHVIDPMAHEREWLSPYNFCSLNPINRIDPNGAFDDWVEKTLDDGSKSVEWDENVTSADDPDLPTGDKYLGKEGYGVEGKGDNEGLVKYGSDGKKYDASLGLAEVEINGGKMSDHAKTMSNPLVQSIHRGQNDFLKESALLSTDILGNVGTGVTFVGYGAAFAPGGQVIAGGLIGTGKAMTTTAGFLQLGINVQDGNYGQAAVNFGFMAGGAVLGTKINSLNFGKQSTVILKTGADLKLNIGNRIVNTVVDRRKNK